MKNYINSQKLLSIWKAIKPWFTFLALLLILRFTGILAGISVFTSSALMEIGLMEAKPENLSSEEYLNYDFTITDLQGEKIDFNKFKGKTIFLNIWATWCGPCRAEMPSIQKLYNATDKENIQFVMLSIDDQSAPEKVSKYIASKKYNFPVFIAGELPSPLNVSVIPTTFVVGPDGKLAYKKSGMANYNSEKFKKFLNGVAAGDTTTKD